MGANSYWVQCDAGRCGDAGVRCDGARPKTAAGDGGWDLGPGGGGEHLALCTK